MGRLDVQQGIVKKWMADKGYGFIAREGQKDVFVHFTDIADDGGDGKRRNLFEGDRVEFEVEQSDRGPKAVNVRTV